VDLFAQRPFRWIQTVRGAWVLSLSRAYGKVRLLQQHPEHWALQHLRPGCPPVTLGDGLPLAYAQGMAEDLARQLGLERLLAADARWRLGPPSDKMVTFAARLGVTVAPAMTAGEVSDRITAIVGDWQ
jgi:hypothetical protein